MYRTVLVDDEIWSLESLQNLISWKDFGYDVIAKISDAKEAFDFICFTKPDVVFTDIRMPDISGIDLINRTRERGINTEFVIVSGYNEFQYAQDALRAGAFDYQLKPIDPESAHKLLHKLKNHLDEGRVVRDIGTFENLICPFNNPYDSLMQYDFIPKYSHWQIVMIGGESIPANWDISRWFRGIHHMLLRLGSDQAMIICNGTQNISNSVAEAIEKSEISDIYSIGLSRVCDDLSTLAFFIYEANMAVNHDFIDGKKGVYTFNKDKAEDISRMIGTINDLLEKEKTSEAARIISNFPDYIRAQKYGMFQVTYFFNQFASIMRNFYNGQDYITRLSFLDCNEIIARFITLNDMCRYMQDLVLALFDHEEEIMDNKYVNENFVKLLEHVKANFDKPMSLSKLAGEYYLNVSYCCELFKKVTGQTFSDYINKMRMEKAYQLLQTGKHSVSSVSGMVGYNDQYYFCKKFKKHYGISPSHIQPN